MEMKRARLESAAEQYDIAEKLLGSGPQDEKLKRQIVLGRAMINYLEGFWKQVSKSCLSFDGDAIAPAAGVTVGFVEGRPDDVVLKMSGAIVPIPYRSLRPGLAMVLGATMADPEGSDWCLQQAAFRIAHFDDSGRSTEKIENQLAKAEGKGLSTDQLRDFWKSDISSLNPIEAAAIERTQVRAAIDQLASKKYRSLSRVSPEMAAKFSKEFTTAPYAQPVQRIAALDESIRLVTKSGDAWLMLDVIDELDRWVEVDTAELKSDAFQKMSKLPDGAVPREIGEAFFEFVKSPDAQNLNPLRLQKVKIMMLEFAKRHGMIDVARLTDQTLE